jgi:flavodoxin/NAD-dependent dihydropyrimidine dehydrogenase PreA subunit
MKRKYEKNIKKILILYFSGVGATKKIAELIYSRLLQNCEVDMFSLENKDTPSINGYDALIIGTPVYHGAPPKVVMNYFDTIARLNKEIYAFIYNTRGTHSNNTNRILSKKILSKKIEIIMDREYRSPASDGSIITPFVKRFFEFEKDIEKKVSHDCMTFLELLEKDKPKSYIPRFRFGSIINAPNKFAGQVITLKIRLHKDKCVKCGRCIEQCPHSTFSTDKDGFPLYASRNYENCYRCIHYCPKLALSLCKRRALKKTLINFYAEQRENASR